MIAVVGTPLPGTVIVVLALLDVRFIPLTAEVVHPDLVGTDRHFCAVKQESVFVAHLSADHPCHAVVHCLSDVLGKLILVIVADGTPYAVFAHFHSSLQRELPPAVCFLDAVRRSIDKANVRVGSIGGIYRRSS